MVEIQSVTASDNLQMNGALELSENLAEGGQVGEGTPDTEDSALGVFKADYLEVRNVEHRSSKTSSERRKGWALVPLRTAPPLTLILTGLFLVALLLILGKQYLPGKRRLCFLSQNVDKYVTSSPFGAQAVKVCRF